MSIPVVTEIGLMLKDKKRFIILELLLENGKESVQEIQSKLGLTGSQLSADFKRLMLIGLVTKVMDGHRHIYSINRVYRKEIRQIIKLINAITAGRLANGKAKRTHR